MDRDIQELKDLMLRTLDSVQSLHVKVDRIEERVTALEVRMSALEERMTALEERVTALEERVSTLEERVTALEEHVAALDSELSALRDSQEKHFETLIVEFSASMDGMNWLRENKVDKSALRQAAI